MKRPVVFVVMDGIGLSDNKSNSLNKECNEVNNVYMLLPKEKFSDNTSFSTTIVCGGAISAWNFLISANILSDTLSS